ncbi:protein zwilch homolog isoform 1-T2 [Amazona ochrocephala]
MEAVSLTGITPVQMLLENGLDKMKKDYVSFFIGVSSYQELIACFTLVLESLECGEIQPWIHHGSGSLLSKLIQQSYHGKMEAVSLTGITPVQMLLEIGLDKMKKDYVNFFIGKPASCEHG